jgi:hypothetical protein
LRRLERRAGAEQHVRARGAGAQQEQCARCSRGPTAFKLSAAECRSNVGTGGPSAAAVARRAMLPLPPPPCAGGRTSRNSITPSRAFLTSGVSVLIFMPGPAGMAHDATGLGLFSTWSEGCARGRAGGRLRLPGSCAATLRCRERAACWARHAAVRGLCGRRPRLGRPRQAPARALPRPCPAPRRGTCGSCRPQTAAGGSRTCACGAPRVPSAARRGAVPGGNEHTGFGGAPPPTLAARNRPPHLGMSMPAASQACRTLQPLGICTGWSFTNTCSAREGRQRSGAGLGRQRRGAGARAARGAARAAGHRLPA